MTKEKFFKIVGHNIKYNHVSFCLKISCSECHFLVKKKNDFHCYFILNLKRNISILEYRNQQLLKEYEKYKTEILIEKLK